MRDHEFDLVVVVVGVVVEKKELFDFGFERQRHGVVHAAVAPADVLLVFLAIVLRVHDQHIGAAQKVPATLEIVAEIKTTTSGKVRHG